MLMYGKEFQNLRSLLNEKYWHLVEEEKVQLKFNVSGRSSTSYIMRN